MKCNPLSDTEVESFKIIRIRLLCPFQRALDRIRERYPETWKRRPARMRLERACINYFKLFFATRKSYLSKEQAKAVHLNSAGWY